MKKKIKEAMWILTEWQGFSTDLDQPANQSKLSNQRRSYLLHKHMEVASDQNIWLLQANLSICCRLGIFSLDLLADFFSNVG